MRPRRFSCNWERKNGAVMMMSREVHSFTGVCFSVLFLFSGGVTARAAVRGLQTAAGHNSFNTHTWTSFSMSAADRWITLLTARLTTIGTHLCMIYISRCDLHDFMASKTVRCWEMESNVWSDSWLCLLISSESSLLNHNFTMFGLS